MSKNSKARRDNKKKSRNKLSRQPSGNRLAELSHHKVTKGLQQLFDPRKLTVPAELNEDIRFFCRSISEIEPIFLEVEPELWSRQSSCNLNVREYIRLNGGEMICGYKIWYHKPKYIEAERHAIWVKDAQYKDISFNADGENRILFLPDSPERQSALDQNKHRFRWGKDSTTRRLIEIQQYAESNVSMQKVSEDVAWNTMLTYEAWKKGQRMPSIITAVRS
jgi:hypothetical protein